MENRVNSWQVVAPTGGSSRTSAAIIQTNMSLKAAAALAATKPAYKVRPYFCATLSFAI